MYVRTVRRFLVLYPLAVVLAVGCAQPGQQAPTLPPAVVTVSRPLEKDVTDYATFTGRTAAVESVEVRARVSGYIQQVTYNPGQEVKEGDLLFQIDPVIYGAALEKARATVKQYEAEVNLARSEHERNRRLVGTGTVSREDYEKSAAQVAQAQANLEGARAMLKTADQNLAWTKVTAPIEGKTGVNLLTKGNLVVADQTLLTSITSQDPMFVYFDVDQNTVLRIQQLRREGKIVSYQKAAYPVDIGLANEEGFPHRGVIDYVSNQVNTSTGTLNVRGRFDNKDRILTPGLFVRVRIPVGQPHKALLVAERALGNDQGQRYLLLVGEGNVVVRRDVQVGGLHTGGLREIPAGLKPDETVIVDGLLRVRPGVTVEPKFIPMPVHSGGANAGGGNAGTGTNPGGGAGGGGAGAGDTGGGANPDSRGNPGGGQKGAPAGGNQSK